MVKNLKFITIIVGILMIVTGVILLFINPLVVGKLPKGFFTPILALEFMHNTAQLTSYFDIVTVQSVKQSLIIGNQVDYVYMCLYSLFIMAITGLIYSESKIKTLLIVLPLVVLVCIADVFENMNIQEILSMNQYQNAGLILEQLHLFTWLKWGGLSTILLILAMYFIQKSIGYKLLGLLMILTFIISFPALILGGIYCEMMANLIMVSFIGLFIFAVTFRPISEIVDLHPL